MEKLNVVKITSEVGLTLEALNNLYQYISIDDYFSVPLDLNNNTISFNDSYSKMDTGEYAGVVLDRTDPVKIANGFGIEGMVGSRITELANSVEISALIMRSVTPCKLLHETPSTVYHEYGSSAVASPPQ